MNEFTKRVIFGLIYVLLIIIATNTNNYIFSGVFYVFMIFCTYELNKMFKIKSFLPYVINSILFSIGTLALFNINEISAKYALIFVFLTLSITFIFALFSKHKNPLDQISKTVLSPIYIGLPFMFLSLIHFRNPDIHGATFKINFVLSVFILLWINDTFAYFIGKKFGKNKLFERISPKKTIEGFIGGLVFTLIFGVIISQINVLQMQNGSFIYNYTLWIIIALIVSIFGTLGDLVESMFKRQSGIKDSSNLIPGHGGFLDRLDSFIFAIPFIFIYLTTFS